jgi:hypothetical protein
MNRLKEAKMKEYDKMCLVQKPETVCTSIVITYPP